MAKSLAFHIAAVAVVLGTGAALAQDVPTLDVSTLCRAEAKAAPNLAEPCMSDQKAGAGGSRAPVVSIHAERADKLPAGGEQYSRHAKLYRAVDVPADKTGCANAAQAIAERSGCEPSAAPIRRRTTRTWNRARPCGQALLNR